MPSAAPLIPMTSAWPAASACECVRRVSSAKVYDNAPGSCWTEPSGRAPWWGRLPSAAPLIPMTSAGPAAAACECAQGGRVCAVCAHARACGLALVLALLLCPQHTLVGREIFPSLNSCSTSPFGLAQNKRFHVARREPRHGAIRHTASKHQPSYPFSCGSVWVELLRERADALCSAQRQLGVCTSQQVSRLVLTLGLVDAVSHEEVERVALPGSIKHVHAKNTL